jgi:hypothetical protein
MPFCEQCSHWMPGLPEKLNREACPRCGSGPFEKFADQFKEKKPFFLTEFVEQHLVDWEEIPTAQQTRWGRYYLRSLALDLALVAAVLLALAWAQNGQMLNEVFVYLTLGAGAVIRQSLRAYWARDVKPKKSLKPTRRQQVAAVEQRTHELQAEISRLEFQLNRETEATPSERGARRQELLKGSLQSAKQSLGEQQAHLFAMQVQENLNSLEGFVAEKLPQAPREALGGLNLELNSYKTFITNSLKFSPSPQLANKPLFLKARALLEAVRERLPELEEDLRDREVLGAVAHQQELSAEDRLSTQNWLYWLHNALPTLDTLPRQIAESAGDPQYQVLGELRIQKATDVSGKGRLET